MTISSILDLFTGDVLKCSFPNCNYSTPKQGHMTQHVNSHLNIRNHICQVRINMGLLHNYTFFV